MTVAQWQTAWEIFDAAWTLPPDQREAFVASSGADPAVAREVLAVLREHEEPSGELAAVPEPVRHPGYRVGRYVLVACAARGGMGEVWAAQDEQLGRRVALKFLAPDPAWHRRPDRHLREARAASALNHPNIVTVHETVWDGATPVIVMEWVQGESLRALLAEGPLALARVVEIGRQVAQALAAAHAGGLVHRDVKPENLLLRQDGWVKVVDFGLARSAAPGNAPRSSAGLAVGTLRYMAPEQLRGEAAAAASDVFALGLVLYELAAAHHAFARALPLDTIQAILTEEPVPLSSRNPRLSPSFETLVEAMLAKDPAARPSAEVVANALLDMPRRQTTAVPARWIRYLPWGAAATLMALTSVWAASQWSRQSAAGQHLTFEQVTTLVPENRATAASLSPDGTQTAYANVDGIFLRTNASSEMKALSAPPGFVVDRLAWFADGTRLVASGFAADNFVPSVWIVCARERLPRLLRSNAREGTPSPDGTRVAFISQDRSEVWVIGADGGGPRRVLARLAEDTFPLVFWSPNGQRLGYQRRHFSAQRPPSHQDWDPYHDRHYESVRLDTGQIVARVPNLWIKSVAALADGRLLFLSWNSPGVGRGDQLWEVHTDPATGAFVRAPRKVATSVGEATVDDHVDGLSASRDGKQVMVLRRFDRTAVYVGDLHGRPPQITQVRRLILNENRHFPHAWTADSHAVIFESDRSGKSFDLFQQAPNERRPRTILATPDEEVLPQLGPDDRWVLYMGWKTGADPFSRKLMRVPLLGGTPEEVPIGEPLDEFRCAIGPGKRCVLRTAVRGQYFAYHELEPISGKGRELARTRWVPSILGDWDVSPDAKFVALPHRDPHLEAQEARIRVVGLDLDPAQRSEREVVLPGSTELRGLIWAADGQGWFASFDTSVGGRMLYVELDGHYSPLADIHGWAVPSPDGHRLAFIDRTIATNAWVLKRP